MNTRYAKHFIISVLLVICSFPNVKAQCTVEWCSNLFIPNVYITEATNAQKDLRTYLSSTIQEILSTTGQCEVLNRSNIPGLVIEAEDNIYPLNIKEQIYDLAPQHANPIDWFMLIKINNPIGSNYRVEFTVVNRLSKVQSAYFYIDIEYIPNSIKALQSLRVPLENKLLVNIGQLIKVIGKVIDSELEQGNFNPIPQVWRGRFNFDSKFRKFEYYINRCDLELDQPVTLTVSKVMADSTYWESKKDTLIDHKRKSLTVIDLGLFDLENTNKTIIEYTFDQNLKAPNDFNLRTIEDLDKGNTINYTKLSNGFRFTIPAGGSVKNFRPTFTSLNHPNQTVDLGSKTINLGALPNFTAQKLVPGLHQLNTDYTANGIGIITGSTLTAGFAIYHDLQRMKKIDAANISVSFNNRQQLLNQAEDHKQNAILFLGAFIVVQLYNFIDGFFIHPWYKGTSQRNSSFTAKLIAGGPGIGFNIKIQ